MKLADAEKLAYELMGQHKLFSNGWGFKFDNARVRFGLCAWSKKTISLSRHLTELNDEEQVRDTILHEIAHALAPKRAGHNRQWVYQCLQVGAKPQRCYSDTAVKTPERVVVGTCPNCERTVERFKRMKMRVALVAINIITAGLTRNTCLYGRLNENR